MDPIFIAVSLIALRKAAESLGESSVTSLSSLLQSIGDRMNEKTIPKAKREALYLTDRESFIDLSSNDIEVIAESIQDEMSEDPEFSKKIEKDTKSLLDEIESESPEVSKEIERKTREMLGQMKNLQNKLQNVTQKVDDIFADIADADFIGRDDTLFSGVPTVLQYHFYGNANKVQINSSEPEKAHTEKNDYGVKDNSSEPRQHIREKKEANNSVDQINRIQKQIERIRSGLTKLIPVEKRLDKLVELREPKPIFNYNRFLYALRGLILADIKSPNTGLIRTVSGYKEFGGYLLGWHAKKHPKNRGNVEKGPQRHKISVDEDLETLENIEESLALALEEQSTLRYVKQDLNRLADKVNVRIAISNDLFIALLYPASACKDLVTNMVSKIGHQELEDEAEMHLGIIGRLVGKLDKISEKLDIEKLREPKGKVENDLVEEENDTKEIIQAIARRLDADNLNVLSPAIKMLVSVPQPKGQKKSGKDDFHEDKKGEGIYILSNEAQAAVGLMAQIEGRRLIVERLVRADRKKQSFTIAVVIAYISIVILSTVISYARFGINSGFVVGDNLDVTKLAFFGIPWPVVLWSLIGSFAAMIYRFNRQPIYGFTDAVKWMLTRPVQGVVLGSAFYLLLASGLFLLTGKTIDSTTDGSSKVTTEIILVLSFLVGFSERFSDSVFNALIERYSAANGNDQNVTSE